MKLAIKKQQLKQLSKDKNLDANATPNVAGAAYTLRCPPRESETGNRYWACQC
ncbi:hypothetical protein [Pseudoalteromonas luteoviolacea]|uniref:Uncharacterized protein n=1 Tax=Pseudoalteromonas luteoviolacea H33 TaxID=1365251 RepID=A0A167EM60_9GAMM|nr:hypothetical protein [Pseudoalteromonas luteoviolacea]KZN50948.1 hypothetical protein N476_15000 [Pseudoalteromonas luteoviolacea H33]KZN75022.1 hypothetical protein N477_20640 [Pseudoalteromonas luteoviolacea H33-S]